MKPRTIVLSALIAWSLSACTVVEQPRHHETRLGIVVAPPPPRVVVVPEPRMGYVWAPGYWRWDGREHVWIEGRWLSERHGEHWVPDRWQERGERWQFEEGHWAR